MNEARQFDSNNAPWWLWPNLLGLDAPVVAVSWQCLLAMSFGIELPVVIHLVLGLSVWCVYLADRLVDVFRIKANGADTERHGFTRKHFVKLIVLLAFLGATNLVLIIRFVPLNLIITGCITAALLAVYYLIRLGFVGKRGSIIPREILCGMLFALGTAIGPYAFAPDQFDSFQYFLPVAFFGLICSANCILISIWEREVDIASNDRSMATTRLRLIPQLSFFLICLAMISGVLAFIGAWQPFLATSLAALAMFIMLKFEHRLSSSLQRALVDALLLTPLLAFVACAF